MSCDCVHHRRHRTSRRASSAKPLQGLPSGSDQRNNGTDGVQNNWGSQRRRFGEANVLNHGIPDDVPLSLTTWHTCVNLAANHRDRQSVKLNSACSQNCRETGKTQLYGFGRRLHLIFVKFLLLLDFLHKVTGAGTCYDRVRKTSHTNVFLSEDFSHLTCSETLGKRVQFEKLGAHQMRIVRFPYSAATN